MNAEKFLGKAITTRGVYIQTTGEGNKFHPPGVVVSINDATWSLLRESGRAVIFDPANPEHAEALKKQTSAAKK
jgi:hypothetical protein